jgi:hypothetical protein
LHPLLNEKSLPSEPTRRPAHFGSTVPGVKAHRAAPASAPELPRSAAEDKAEHGMYVRSREAAERRSVLRGLILLAVLVVVFAALHAGLDRAFPAGWLHRW